MQDCFINLGQNVNQLWIWAVSFEKPSVIANGFSIKSYWQKPEFSVKTVLKDNNFLPYILEAVTKSLQLQLFHNLYKDPLYLCPWTCSPCKERHLWDWTENTYSGDLPSHLRSTFSACWSLDNVCKKTWVWLFSSDLETGLPACRIVLVKENIQEKKST